MQLGTIFTGNDHRYKKKREEHRKKDKIVRCKRNGGFRFQGEIDEINEVLVWSGVGGALL